MSATHRSIVGTSPIDRRVTRIAHRDRQGSVIVALIAPLVVMAIFFGMYFVKQLQANRLGNRLRAEQQVQQEEFVQDRHCSPSPELSRTAGGA